MQFEIPNLLPNSLYFLSIIKTFFQVVDYASVTPIHKKIRFPIKYLVTFTAEICRGKHHS